MTYDVLICFFFCHPHHEPSEMPMYKGVEGSLHWPQSLCCRASPAFGVRVGGKNVFLVEKRCFADRETTDYLLRSSEMENVISFYYLNCVDISC